MHPLLLAMMMLSQQNPEQMSQNKPEKKESVVTVEIEVNEQQQVGQKRKRSSDQDDGKPFVIHVNSFINK